ncbi:MAG: hypothetical protein AAF432_11355 [Planctomycetota bacterium]
MGAQFLNVDLNLTARESLVPFATWYERYGFALHQEEQGPEWFGRYELEFEGDLVQIFERQCVALESMPEDVVRLWNDATSRVLSIGIEATPGLDAGAWIVSPALLTRIADLRTELEFVVYGASGDFK